MSWDELSIFEAFAEETRISDVSRMEWIWSSGEAAFGVLNRQSRTPEQKQLKNARERWRRKHEPQYREKRNAQSRLYKSIDRAAKSYAHRCTICRKAGHFAHRCNETPRLISCACGCAATLQMFNDRGQRRQFINGHNRSSRLPGEEFVKKEQLAFSLAGTRKPPKRSGDATWSKAETKEVSDILMGQLRTLAYGYELGNSTWCSPSAFHRVWDHRRKLLETRSKDVVARGLTEIIGVRHRWVSEHRSTAAHYRAHFQDEATGARFDEYACEYVKEAERLERLLKKVLRLGVPVGALADADKWVPRATDAERAAAAAEDARVKGDWDRVGELVDLMAAADGGNPSLERLPVATSDVPKDPPKDAA